MDDEEQQPSCLALRQLDSLDSPLHRQLLVALDHLALSLNQLVRDAESTGSSKEEQEALKTQVYEAVDKHNYVMSGIQMFHASLEEEAKNLEQSLQVLDKKRADLLEERDELIERGHELNCRIGYNALERKLEETFTDIEKYTSLESAKCFRDEAEEHQRRSNDLIRIGNMRACQVDRDLYNEMEKITDLFENYERDREHYVRELDLFSDVRRQRVSAWLAKGGHTDREREAGENVLDFLSLTEKRRHMEPQLIKSALRMYSFNASLNFDREDNEKLLDDLSSVQNEVNAMSDQNIVLPRHSLARTGLTEDTSTTNPDSDSEDVTRCQEDDEPETGRGLHRCRAKQDLVTDPITEDDELFHQLQSDLCWEDPECCKEAIDQTEALDQAYMRADIPEQTDHSQSNVKVVDVVGSDFVGSAEGDNQQKGTEDKEGESVAEVGDLHLNTIESQTSTVTAGPGTGDSHTVLSVQHAERHTLAVTRKKKSSLTSFSPSECPVITGNHEVIRSHLSEPIVVRGNSGVGGARVRDVIGELSRQPGNHRLRECSAERRTSSTGNMTSLREDN